MRLDLAPAKWIWLPSERTLANTVVLLRRAVTFQGPPKWATGWIAADSRYRLWVNGELVQRGPAPHDPRHAEADPIELTPFLRSGDNVVAVEVLYFGHGEGTWPAGKPGFLFSLEADGKAIVSDATWRCLVDPTRPPGGFRRWYLRSLQEIVDLREEPTGWREDGFDDAGWLAAMELDALPSRSAYSGAYREYAVETWMTRPAESTLSARSIPLLDHSVVEPVRVAATGVVTWHRSPDDWFRYRVPGSLTVANDVRPSDARNVVVPTGPRTVTYEFAKEIVGYPFVEIDAPKGTVVEIMVQESHDPAARPWLDSHHFQWTRFVCPGERFRFEAFDYEALRWLQLHVHEHDGPVTVAKVGVVKRTFPWPRPYATTTDDAALQRLWDAASATLDNSAQDIVVDGMGRERQQYSGDCGHQLHAVRMARGEVRLPARYLRTFGQGQFLSGVFSDSWPAVDRLNRLWERQIDGSVWGPIIDHSIGFVFDHFHHWMESGDLSPFVDNADRLAKFVAFLRRDAEPDGWLPSVRTDEHAVWLDHDAYPSAAHKRVALNLYAVAMLRHAYAPLLKATGQPTAETEAFADAILKKTIAEGWDPARKVFVGGRPIGDGHVDDRALATAVIYGLNPGGENGPSVALLADPASGIGQSYPANRPWNHWALIEGGGIDAVLTELRTRWATMTSVVEAGTIGEVWVTRKDSQDLMSHCALAPLISLHHGVLGFRPLAPGFAEWEVRPRLGDLRTLTVDSYAPVGTLHLEADEREVRLQAPGGKGRIRFADGTTAPLVSGQAARFDRARFEPVR